MAPLLPPVLRPVPKPSPRPWAGSSLGDGIGELWLAGPDSTVVLAQGVATLDDLALSSGAPLVGTRGMERLGARFPLLVKLIDAGDWLSLQVHPSDAVARRIHGSEAIGKAEAWLVLDADPGALLVTGPRAGLAASELRAKVAAGSLDRDDCSAQPATAGDVLHLPAGTIHAIGAGTFVYEIEQPSDLTYRISDWGRPPVPGRRLHTAEALEAVDAGQRAVPCGTGWVLTGGSLAVPEFKLEILGPGGSHARNPGGETPEVVSVVGGSASLVSEGWQEQIAPNEALVVTAACGAYRIEAA
ncbi:MAG TPA: type I phosphomannose isomerase catalytic subunit, partial [Candidatus Limnocylindrales bacterium]